MILSRNESWVFDLVIRRIVGFAAFLLFSPMLIGCSSMQMGGLVPGGGFLAPATPSTVNRAIRNTDLAAGVETAWEVPRCLTPLGSIALVESAQAEATPGSVDSANTLLRLFTQQSGCFTVIDYGPAKALASGGANLAETSAVKELPEWSRMDYILTAKTIYQDVRLNDFSLASLVSNTFSERSISHSASTGLATVETEIGVVLLLINAKTGNQIASEFGLAKKADVSISAFNAGAFNASNPSGKTASAAIFHAFCRLVESLNRRK